MMGKHTKTSLLVVAFLAPITVASLSACQLRPQLKLVAADAPDKPINTPEAADQLKKKYEK